MTARPDEQIPAPGEHVGEVAGESSGGGPRRQPGPARRLARPATGLAAVVVFQMLLASVFLSVLHRPALHHAPVAVVGTSPLAAVVSRHGGGAIRLALLAFYAAVSGSLGALVFGPAMGVAPGYSAALAGVGMLVVFAAATATAGLQAALGLPGTLLAIIAMVVFGDPTAGTSIATPLLASPWNVIGQGLPPGAGLAAARSVLYLDGMNLAGPLTVLATYAAAGTLLMLAAAAWWPRHQAVPAAPGQPAPGNAP